MSFYVACPSCRRTLSKNKAAFMKARQDIEHNPTTTKEEKADQFAALVTKNYPHRCCALRIMGELPYHEIVQ